MPAGATYEPIATTTLTTSSATIDFTSISASYTDLRLILNYTATTGGGELDLRFNSNSATNYSAIELYGTGSAAFSTYWATKNAIYLPGSAGSSTTIPTLVTIDVFSYAGSTNKTVLSTWSGDRNGSGIVSRSVGLWRSTAAITTINLLLGSGSFAIGTTATLYGIKAA